MKRKSSLKRFLKANKIGLLVFILSFIFVSQVNAANTGLNWENPNKGGNNPYKITTDTVLNSQTLTKIVGCTGIVNKISGAVTNLLSGTTSGGTSIDLTKLTKQELGVLNEKQLKSLICLGFKGSSQAAVATIPTLTLPTALQTTVKCNEEAQMESKELSLMLGKLLQQGNDREKRESCFNGLAYTLAKNQLTSMTRETLNWINTGFSGNPLYVQSMRSLNNSIEKNVVESGIQILADGAFPYEGDFSQTILRSRNSKIANGAVDFLGSLTSDLSAFLTDKDSYGLGNTYDTISAKKRAMYDVDRFANDFSVGGWNGYLALTQREQNNPLGFTMMASQYVADRINQQSNEMKDEISQNNGFLSQKECVTWELHYGKGSLDANGKSNAGQVEKNSDGTIKTINRRRNPTAWPDDKCTEWKNITPGSIIKDKLSVYVNSPERQLELADDINSVLNSLFTKLIENFRSEGLLGLSQEKYVSVDDLIGYGANGVGVQYIADDTSGYYAPSYSSGLYESNSKSFNILKDLGNTYYHDSVYKVGTWNAKNNNAIGTNGSYFYDTDGSLMKELNVGLGVKVKKCDLNNECAYVSPEYQYYYLVIPENGGGSTKLFDNGYNGWAVGDRAFWNGEEWQNWKAGEQSPIKKRGIIQIQKDYAVAAKEILKVLPGVMPRLGELDYCIPGPNPNFSINSSEPVAAFSDFTTSLSGMYNVSGFLKRDSTTFSLAKEGSYMYDKYHEIFKDLPVLLDVIKNTSIYTRLTAYNNKTIKNDRKEGAAYDIITDMITSIGEGIQSFLDSYQTNVFEGIYGVMREKYLEKEDTTTLTENTAYLPMIEDGYNLTRDLVEVDNQISNDITKYRNDIATADGNTTKLNLIRLEVDKIIGVAQARRNKRIEQIVIPMMKNEYKSDMPNMTDDQARAKYKEDYKNCFDEEYIDYLDYGDIITNSEDESTRCFDNIDNDLDGLIDAKDKDCKGIIINPHMQIMPSTIKIGSGSEISWETNGDNCKLYTLNSSDFYEEIGEFGGIGRIFVSPNKTSKYKLICYQNNIKLEPIYWGTVTVQ